MREKNSIFSMKKQHPKTHTPLYLELLIPLKIMLKNYAKTHFSERYKWKATPECGRSVKQKCGVFATIFHVFKH